MNEVNENTPQYTLIRFTEDYRKWMKSYGYGEYDTMKETCFSFLGMIPNMEGHCIVAGHSGKVYFGMHPEDFEVLSEEEV